MEPVKTSALDHARADLTAGRPDLARDRVQGFLHSQMISGEYSEETYLLLGEIYFAMQDYARAGAAWLLTEKEGAEALKAIEAFHERHGIDPVNILKAVKPRAPSENYPPKVGARLLEWNYRYLPYRSRAQKRAAADEPDEDRPAGIRPIEAGCIVAAGFAFLFLCVYAYLAVFGRR